MGSQALGLNMKVYIGFDPREQDAYDVAEFSLRRRTSVPIEVTALRAERLAANGLLYRPTDRRGEKIYDITSNAPASTEFAISRFLVPHLAQSGWALFVDADMLFLDDVGALLQLADPKFAVQVVKHDHRPTVDVKMDNQVQTRYARKNWSSVVLWNCDHPANLRLSLRDVNERRGLELHQFYWLHDAEIGELPGGWNWLVGEQEKPDEVHIAHFTNGVPTMRGHENDPHAELWMTELNTMRDALPR